MKRLIVLLSLIFCSVCFASGLGENIESFNDEAIVIINTENQEIRRQLDVKVEGLTDMDVDSTATEIDQALDGIGSDVTAANLDTLTDGSNADSLHTHAGLVTNIAAGTYAGTGSSVNVEFGFQPTMVQIFDVTGQISWWVDTSVDGSDAHWHGPTGNAGATYTVTFDAAGFNTTGAAAHTNGRTYYYIAMAN